MGIGKILHVYNGLSKPYSGHRSQTTKRPRLFRLKEKTLRYRFTIQHCPGKWHSASDAVSHNPATILQARLNVFPADPSRSDIIEFDEMDVWVKSTTLLATFGASNNIVLISPDIIHADGCSDLQYNKLIDTKQNRFQKICSLTAPKIREYWELKQRWISAPRSKEFHLHFSMHKSLMELAFCAPRRSWYEGLCQ